MERPVKLIPRRPDQLDGRRLTRLIDEHLRPLHAQPAHGNRKFDGGAGRKKTDRRC